MSTAASQTSAPPRLARVGLLRDLARVALCDADALMHVFDRRWPPLAPTREEAEEANYLYDLAGEVYARADELEQSFRRASHAQLTGGRR